MTRAFITGIAGTELSAPEREFIRAESPWGFILFKRNVDSPAQVASLVSELRGALGEPDAPVLIDQEGGRVQRLGPPNWAVSRRARFLPRFTAWSPNWGQPQQV